MTEKNKVSTNPMIAERLPTKTLKKINEVITSAETIVKGFLLRLRKNDIPLFLIVIIR
jgi:hypothetical protein